MHFSMKIIYVIAENHTGKVLYTITDTIDSYDSNLIGEKAMKLWQMYKNCYVLIKIC